MRQPQRIENTHTRRMDATMPLAVIQTDTTQLPAGCGPTWIDDNGVLHQYKYMIAFIDNMTRFIVHWELLETHHAAGCAHALQVLIDKIGITLFERLHTDNGTEFKAEFEQLLLDKGIRLTHSTPYTP